jgi:hypothetical protein
VAAAVARQYRNEGAVVVGSVKLVASP